MTPEAASRDRRDDAGVALIATGLTGGEAADILDRLDANPAAKAAVAAWTRDRHQPNEWYDQTQRRLALEAAEEASLAASQPSPSAVPEPDYTIKTIDCGIAGCGWRGVEHTHSGQRRAALPPSAPEDIEGLRRAAERLSATAVIPDEYPDGYLVRRDTFHALDQALASSPVAKAQREARGDYSITEEESERIAREASARYGPKEHAKAVRRNAVANVRRAAASLASMEFATPGASRAIGNAVHELNRAAREIEETE